MILRKTLFHEEWWLSAVAPKSIVSFSAKYKNHEIVWPFQKKVDRLGLSFYTTPPLTQTLGPYLSTPGVVDLGMTKHLLEEIINNLPDKSTLNFKIPYTFNYFLPLFWAGFTFTPLVTFTLDPKEIIFDQFSGLSKNIIGDIKKAQKNLKVASGLDPEKAYSVLVASYMKKGLVLPYEKQILLNIWKKSYEQDRGLDLYAIDDQNNLHASIFCVWDEYSMYYLFSVTNPQYKGSGANSLLLWKAIEISQKKGLIFDFEGSMNPNIENFFRGFGTVPRIYLYGQKSLSKIDKIKKIGKKWIS